MPKQASILSITLIFIISSSAFASLSTIDQYHTLSYGGMTHVKNVWKKSSKRAHSGESVHRVRKQKNGAQNLGSRKISSTPSLVCMARNIYFEAGIESTKGKIAVANVTMNRVRSKHYPESVCGVVYQKGRRTCAFSWTCDRKSNVPPHNSIYEESLKIARLALSGALKDITGDADHYHATYVNPDWNTGMEKKAKIGHHIFYKQYNG